MLVAHKTNRTANRLLAALMIAFTIFLISDAYYAAGLQRRFPHFFGMSYPLPWLFGPLVYLYTLTASDRARNLRRKDALHFLPAVAVVLLTLPIYMMDGSEKIALYDRLQRGDVPTLLRVLEPTKFVSGIAYSVATIVLLMRHHAQVKDSYSTLERVNLRWLLWLAGATAAIWAAATLFDVADLVNRPFPRHGDDVVMLGIAVVVYAIGYMGLRQPEIFRFDVVDERRPRLVASETPPPAAPPTPPPTPPTSQSRYERSGLGELEAKALKKALLAKMESDHPYRDPDLTLSDLAAQLDTTPHKLSEVLNGELKQTFYDFVNAYRVEEVLQRLAEGASEHRKLLAVAMDAGFASKSTFNQVFKKQTGHTPSTYRRVKVG